MVGRILIKILAKIVVGVEHARHAFRRAFAPRITVVKHLAILREVIDNLEGLHAGEKTVLESAARTCEAERHALADGLLDGEDTRQTVPHVDRDAVQPG